MYCLTVPHSTVVPPTKNRATWLILLQYGISGWNIRGMDVNYRDRRLGLFVFEKRKTVFPPVDGIKNTPPPRPVRVRSLYVI